MLTGRQRQPPRQLLLVLDVMSNVRMESRPAKYGYGRILMSVDDVRELDPAICSLLEVRQHPYSHQLGGPHRRRHLGLTLGGWLGR